MRVEILRSYIRHFLRENFDARVPTQLVSMSDSGKRTDEEMEEDFVSEFSSAAGIVGHVGVNLPTARKK